MVWGWVSLCYIDLLWSTPWFHITHSIKDYLNILLVIYRNSPLSPSKEGREDNTSGVIIGITTDLF